MKKFFLFGLSLLIISMPAMVTAGKKSQGTTVNIPWSEFSKILEQLKKLKTPKAKPQSPVPFVMSRTDYKLYAAKNSIRGSVTFNIYVLNDTWIQAPLLDQRLAVEKALINGKPLMLFKKNKRYNALIKGPGRFVVKLRLSTRVKSAANTHSVSFSITPSPVTLLELTIPGPESRVTSTPEAVSSTRRVNNSTVYSAYFPATSNLGLEWVSGIKKVETVKKEPRVFINTSNLLSIGEGHIRSRLFLNLEVLQAGIDSLIISLPAGMNFLSLSPSENMEWDIMEKDGKQVIKISIGYPLLGKKTFVVDADYPMKDVSGYVNIGSTGIEPSNRTTGYIALSARTNVEIIPKDIKKLVRIDQTELPPRLVRATDKPVLHAFKYVSLPYSLGIDIKRHKDVAVLTTAADRAEILTLNTGKQIITRYVLHVRNNLRQYIEFELPDKAVLWSTFTNGQPTKPGRGTKENSILVPLLKSRPGSEQEASFPVEILYFMEKKSAACVGSFKQVLPRVDIPISTIQWEVYFPNKWRVLGVTGDFREGRAFSPTPQRRNKKREKRKYNKPLYLQSQGLQSNVPQSVMPLPQGGGMATGQLPVHIEIPRVGSYKVFTKNYYTPEASARPKFSIHFVTPRVIKTFRIIFLILGFIFTLKLDTRDKKKSEEQKEPKTLWRRIMPSSREFIVLVLGIVVIHTISRFLGGMYGPFIWGMLLGLIIGIPYRRLKN